MSQGPGPLQGSAPRQGLAASGLIYHPQYFSKDAQLALLETVEDRFKACPPFQPVMPRTGTPFLVQMSNWGPLGWVSDRAGYRYQPLHPDTGAPWPAIPEVLLGLWRDVAGGAAEPEACLVNLYGPHARMGSHQDRDEADFSAPVVSVSLGDTAAFHVGGLTRNGPKTRFKLASGDVLVLGGDSRLAFHGIDRIYPGTSPVPLPSALAGVARINLTLRRVSKPL